MKKILPLFILIWLSINTFGQGLLKIEPTMVEQTFSVDLSDPTLDLELYSTVTNLSSDTLMLKWERIINDSPVDWWTQVCDKNLCYDPPISTNYDPGRNIREPVLLEPDSSFTLIFHVLPNQMPGIGSFDLPFSSIDSADVILETVTFIANVDNTTSISDVEKQQIKVFPNPTQEYFEIKGADHIDKVVMYSLLGNKVAEFTVFPDERYDISELPNGLYLLTMVNQEYGVVKTLRLSKRSFRP